MNSFDLPSKRLTDPMKPAGLAVLFMCCSFALGVAEPPPRAMVVWDFEDGITNPLGGQYNTYQREPSWARTYLDPRVTRTPRGHALRVTAHREAEGFCGLWLDFYPAAEAPRQHLDATPYRYLSFWAKGQKGGEDFEIELIDEATLDDEEARVRRPLRAYLPRGLSTTWQQILIPLADFGRIQRQRLVKVTLNLSRRGDYRFYLDDLGFRRDAGASPEPRDPSGSASGAAQGTAHRALWAWNTKPLLDPDQPEAANRFFAFCASHQIQRIYLAAEFDWPTAGSPSAGRLRNPEGYRAFLARAHQQGLKVDGLAGTPEWAVCENHAHALAAVDAILAFNEASPAGGRLDGIHFDVEPYTLMGYSDPSYRPEILLGLLEMNEKCAGRARAGGLSFSCDVPSWFYPGGGLERDRLMVNFKGEEKTVGEHLTDMLDSVTIMDYTNRADGAGGIIARGLPALHYAASRKKKIVVGVETFSEGEKSVAFVCGLPAEEFWPRLARTGLRNQLFYEDFRMSLCSDDVNLHIGLAEPREMTPEKRTALETALARLARQLGASSDPERYFPFEMLGVARAALAENPDWKGFEPFEITDPETGKRIQGFRSVHRMLPSITFHGLGREVFQEEVDSTIEWLGRHASFGGVAIHFYESFRELMEGGNQESGVRSRESAGKK